MSRRGLTPGMCDIQVLNQNRRANWDDNISDYENLEIQVTIKERFPFITSISHNFVSNQTILNCSNRFTHF